MFKSLVIPIKAFFAFFLVCFSFISMAQVVDTLKSEQIYTVLTSCEYNKTIIDGRDSAKYYSGYIKNAIYVDAFSEDALLLLKNYIVDDTLIVYCSNQTRSLIIIDKLKELNYRGKIIYMQDGIVGWKNNGYPIETLKVNE